MKKWTCYIQMDVYKALKLHHVINLHEEEDLSVVHSEAIISYLRRLPPNQREAIEKQFPHLFS